MNTRYGRFVAMTPEEEAIHEKFNAQVRETDRLMTRRPNLHIVSPTVAQWLARRKAS